MQSCMSMQIVKLLLTPMVSYHAWPPRKNWVMIKTAKQSFKTIFFRNCAPDRIISK